MKAMKPSMNNNFLSARGQTLLFHLPFYFWTFSTGLDLGLGLSTLKVQVTAISAATHKRWAEDLLIIQFFKAVRKIRPPIKRSFPKSDLSLVLEVLPEGPFAPSEECSL